MPLFYGRKAQVSRLFLLHTLGFWFALQSTWNCKCKFLLTLIYSFMKHLKHLFTVLLLLCSVAVNAHNFEVDGIYYNITDATNKTVAVTYRGSSYAAYSNEYTGDVTIPETVTYNSVTYIVTSIGDEAFYDCSGLTSIEIPNSVTSIGSSAFYGTAWYDNQPDGLIYAGKVLYKYKGTMPTSITIKDGTLGIAGGAFRYRGLTSIEIPNSVTSIGDYAFSSCTGLTSIEIPNSVTSIGSSAFYSCSGLTAVHISDVSAWCNIDFASSSANPLGSAKNLYLNDELVTELVIPEGVTEIKDYAFSSCTGLTSIEIPNSVTSIGSSAFYSCSGLTAVHISDVSAWCNIDFASSSANPLGSAKNLYLNDELVTELVIPEGVTEIKDYAFENCKGLTSVVIPGSVTRIEYGAFSDCSGLTSVTIPNSVTSIGYGTFYGCSALTSIEIPNSVTSIGNFAFKGCSGLTSVTIGNSVTSIENEAFSGCKGLTSIEIPNSVTSIGYKAFYSCSGLTSIEIPNSVTSIGSEAFVGCSEIKRFTIPNSVTSIGRSAFEGTAWYNNQPNGLIYAGKVLYKYKGTMPGNYEIVVKNGTLGIAGGAFQDCDGLTSIEIPNSVTSIGDGAFYYCTGLTSIEIPNSVTSIGDKAFYSCSGLTSIEIPNSVTSIGDKAFYSCSGLTSIEIPNSVTSIGNYVFRGCSGLTSVTIGNSVTSIGDGAFQDCDGLTSIEIPNSVTSIGEDAFYYCTGLTSIEIPNSVTSIGDHAFYSCSGLTSIEIPNSVTSIGYKAFNGCTSLKNLRIEDGEGTLSLGYNDYNSGTGKGLFYDCPLETLYLGRNLSYNTSSSYGYSSFYNIKTLTSVTIGNSVTSIGDDAFSGCSGLKTVVNFSYLTFEKGSSDNGYIAYYADKVLNLPNGSIEGDFGFAVIDGVNLLVAYLGNETEITLPDSYKGESYEIAANAFKQNYSITNVNFTNGVTSIGEYAFSGCISIEKIALPNSLATIGDYAFYCCYGLRKVVVPENITYIGESAFENCTALAEIRSFIPAERLFVPGDYAFEGVDKDACILYVPQGAKEAYATTAGWSDFANIIDGGNMFTVTYIVDGEVYAIETVEYGAEIPAVDTPVREGYTFRGWSEVPAKMPAEDITITGSFAVNSYTVTYIVDGEVYATDSVAYGDEVVLIDEPVREGYTFSGWSEVPATMPAEDITVEGSFAVNTYVVTYIVDGEVYATDSVAYGDEVVLIDEPVREGYTFSGWSEVPATMPAEDITITGSFAVNSYTVTYIVDGEVYATDSVAYGDEIVLIDEPVREGYTFSGWSEIPERMPANNITIEGKFTVKSYTITYVVDGEVYATDSVAYGDEVVLIDEPVREGYTFSGWSEVPATMPAEDITVTGSFSKNDTGIDEVTGEEKKVVYDLNGRRITDTEHLERGVYIINGKKTVVK